MGNTAAIAAQDGLAPVSSSRPPPMSCSRSLLQELNEVDDSLNISDIEHPPVSSLSNTGIMVSTPMQGASVFSALGVKRPASAFAKVSKAVKKPRLLVPASVQTVSNSVGSKQHNDSGLDRSGVDPTNVSCGPALKEDSFGTPMTFTDGNVTLNSTLSPSTLLSINKTQVILMSLCFPRRVW